MYKLGIILELCIKPRKIYIFSIILFKNTVMIMYSVKVINQKH